MADIKTDGLATDRQVAEFLNKHPKTLPRWDKDPRLLALGWPAPIYLNGRRHREWSAIRDFIQQAATAHLNSNPAFKA